jgi:hypothetical protein
MDILQAVNILRGYGYIINWMDCGHLKMLSKKRMKETIYNQFQFREVIALAEKAHVLNCKHANITVQ